MFRPSLCWVLCCAATVLLGDDLFAADRPNVLVVMTDDQGYGDLGCHGHPQLKTPHLDRLYRESVRLTDFHVCPMCTPTRGQLLTGVDCLRNGAMNVSSGRTMLRRGIPTLADICAANGYRTGQFGKWHLGDNYPYRPQDRGFQETLWFPSSHIGSAPDFWDNDYFDDVYQHNGKREKFSGYCTDVFFDEAQRWMKTCAERREPFFCYVATNAPHGPLFVDPKYSKPYAELYAASPAKFFGMIANIDENMGKLDEFLTTSGLRENTIVIFLTDNGGTAGVPIYNAGMRGKKIDLWDGGHRVPCFIRWPAGKLPAGTDIAETTTVQDLAPTLCAWAKLKTDAKFDGLSLANCIAGTEPTLPDRKIVIQFSRMNAPQPAKDDACILWNKWRLVQNKELYDIQKDPAQQTNLFAQQPEIVRQMQEHYSTWWSGVEKRVNDLEHIMIGSNAENPLLLSPADWADSFLDQGAQVRNGIKRNGDWLLEVTQEGEYEFTLRRWPAEIETPLAAGLPEHPHALGSFPAGAALPITQAKIVIGKHAEQKAVAATETGVTFTIKLPAGNTTLHTELLDREGKELCGAYYVTVTRK